LAFIAHSLYAADKIVFISKEPEPALRPKFLSGLILVLFASVPAALYAQISTPNEPRPAPPSLQNMPPAKPGSVAPSIPAVCSLHKRFGPFLTSDDAELAAQSFPYPILGTSPVYSEGFPDSDLNPLQYYFYADILTACN
jgi:hypothetical protein